MKSSRRPMSSSQLTRWASRCARSGETDTKTVVIIIIAVVGGMLLIGCAGIAVLLLPVASGGSRGAARQMQSKNNLKQFGLALHNYHDVYTMFPAGGYYAEDGTPYQSWQYSILPFVDQPMLFNAIDPDYPWTDPVNEDFYRSVVQQYVHPSEQGGPLTPDGFGVSHYAGNSQVFRRNKGLMMREILDGTSNTLMAGDVGDGFMAWGDPANLRDPAAGIGVGPNTFGRDDTKLQATMLMMDGSVREISADVNPATLKALSTYDGGEPVNSF